MEEKIVEQVIEDKSKDNFQKTIEDRKTELKTKLFGWVKDNYDKLFLVILIIAFIIRLMIFLKTMNQPLWWDAADYMATAKNWAGTNSHLLDTWYYRRGFLWALWGTIFFKLNLGEIAVRFSVVLFSTGVVAVSYFLIKKMFNKKLALLTSLGLTFSWVFLFFTGRILTNLPATFFLLISVLLFWKGYVLKEGNKFIYLFGLFFALACLTRMQYLMFAIPILALIFTKEKFRFLKNKQLWLAIGIFLLVFTPQLIMHGQHFGNPFLDLTNYYLGIEGISQSGEVGVKLVNTSDLFLWFNNLPYILDGTIGNYSSLFSISPIYLLFVIGFFWFFADLFLGFDKLFKNKSLQKKFFILVWMISTLLFLGYIAPQLEQRYIMQTLPFLFLIAAFPLVKIGDYIYKKFKYSQKICLLIIVGIFVLLLIPNFSFGNSLTESKKTSYLEVKQAGLWIKQNSELSDIVISGSLPQTTYYSERSTYPFNLAYRRDISRGNESDFDEFVNSKKPRYLILSAFEKQPEWVYQYPDKNKDLLIPVQAYRQGEQTTLIIYEFQYS